MLSMKFATFACLVGFATVGLAQDVLLIPDSSDDRVMAFNPFDGSIVNLNYIPSTAVEGASLGYTPKNAIDSGRGTIFVSDQVRDKVYEFDRNGTFLGDVVGATGLDNIRGIAVRNGVLYITNAGTGNGSSGDSIRAYDLTSGVLSTFIAPSANLGDPFDITFRDNDLLIADISGDDIRRFDFSGGFLGIFHNSNGTTGIDFPQQVSLDGDNILVNGFSAPIGIYRYDSVGTQLNYYATTGGGRGVFRLGNGDIFFTDGAGVKILDPDTGGVTSVFSTSGAQYIEFLAAPVPEPATLIALALGAAAVLRRRKK